jgi:hypothetical protein
VERLVASLLDKRRYVVELRALQAAMRQGVELVAVHRVLTYRQEPWLRSFVDRCVTWRRAAANVAEGGLAKLMCNALFGRLCMNVRKFQSLYLYNEEKKCLRRIAKPTYRGTDVVYRDAEDASKGLFAVHCLKQRVTLDSAVLVGACILDVAKAHNTGLWYTSIRSRWPNARLLYHDSDSFYVSVECGQHVGDVLRGGGCFAGVVDADGSRQPGLLKVERDAITEWIGLAPKTYSYTYENGEHSEQRAAGMTTAPGHAEYGRALYGGVVRLLSDLSSVKGHRLRRETVQRRLNEQGAGDKRWWLPGAVDSLALGHMMTG